MTKPKGAGNRKGDQAKAGSRRGRSVRESTPKFHSFMVHVPGLSQPHVYSKRSDAVAVAKMYQREGANAHVEYR